MSSHPPDCVHCHHPARQHVQSDDWVWCSMCQGDCYVPDSIDDIRWIGGDDASD